MYSRIIHIIVLAVALFFAFSASPSIALDVPSQYEQDLLQLINEARENPLAVATSLGMDADQILQDFPDLKDILMYGLPPLSFNEKLYAAAGAHTRDMLENNYYSHTSIDGRTCDDRIVEKGYDPVVTGESLGMLAFSNFISPDNAVEILFKNMFLDELNPERTEQRNILNPYMRDVGIGISTGAMHLNDGPYNVYLATCNFAASYDFTIKNTESTLLHLINQARAKPLQVAESLRVDPDQLLADLPELSDVLTQGLPPLGLNAELSGAAASHTWDMTGNRFYGHDSSDGRTHEDRMAEISYDGASTGETLGLYFVGTFLYPSDAVERIFENIFLHELRPNNACKRNILNPDFDEAGIGFGFGGLDMDGLIMDAYVVTCDFGAMGSDREKQYLLGVVYTDFNQDRLYTPGEGDQSAMVILEKWDYPELFHEVDNMLTDPTGGFSFSVGDGLYRITVQRSGQPEQCDTQRVDQENLFMEFRADAES